MKSTHELMIEIFGEDDDPSPENLADDATTDFLCSVYDEMNRQGVSVSQLARLMGKSQSTVSEKLSGDCNLTVRSMAEIAFALGCRLQAPLLVPMEEKLAEVVEFDGPSGSLPSAKEG